MSISISSNKCSACARLVCVCVFVLVRELELANAGPAASYHQQRPTEEQGIVCV